ncbi:MAG: hypothetical protein ACE5KT_10855 [Methanosarcinales archaeon]
MPYKIEFTNHYKIFHESEVPKDLAIKVILTGKRTRIGKDLFKYISKSKKQVIYVLCRFDYKNQKLIVINAKKARRK